MITDAEFQSHFGLILTCSRRTSVELTNQFQSHFGLILTEVGEGEAVGDAYRFQSHFGLILTGRIFSLFDLYHSKVSSLRLINLSIPNNAVHLY